MTHSFSVFIDESGDDGMKKFRQPGAGGGASHWLMIGACIARTSRELDLVQIRDEIKSECRQRQGRRDIHFKDFNHNQRRKACQILGAKPLRFTCVLACKTELDADNFKGKNQLYFYVTRYLIERVSWLCRDLRPHVREGDGTAKIVFSRRGGLNYESFQSYLEKLKKDHESNIHWPVIDLSGVRAEDHSKLAGLQIADCGVSAIASAVEPDMYGNVEESYIEAISGRIYSRNSNYMSYGLKFLPRLETLSLSTSQRSSLRKFV